MATDFFWASPNILAESQPWCVFRYVLQAAPDHESSFTNNWSGSLLRKAFHSQNDVQHPRWSHLPSRACAPSSPPPSPFTTSHPRSRLREKSMGAVPPSLPAAKLNSQLFSKFCWLKKARKGRQETLRFHDNNNFCCGTCVFGWWRLRSLKINKQSHLLDAWFFYKLRKRNCSFWGNRHFEKNILSMQVKAFWLACRTFYCTIVVPVVSISREEFNHRDTRSARIISQLGGNAIC